MQNDISSAAMEKLTEYMGEELTDRQKTPCDDMLTDLLNGEIVDEDGEPRRLTMEQASTSPPSSAARAPRRWPASSDGLG